MIPENRNGMEQENRVTVVAPARLHLGFVDMHGGLGRSFGSLGVALEDVATRLTAVPAATMRAAGPGAERALRYARTLLDELGIAGAVDIRIESAIPEHAGLGSGTQMALAVGAAILRLFGVDAALAQLASLTARGQRSGIGIGAFEQGGFLVDGGRGPNTAVPPIIARLPFPAAWRFLLIFDSSCDGLHGTREVQAFQAMPPMSPETAGDLCRRVLMQLLPTLIEQDFPGFSAALTYVQERVGDQFAGFQGGRYASPRVAGALAWLRGEGVAGLGQSSWGPTGFALCDSAVSADRLRKAAERRFSGDPALSFKVAGASNRGAEVEMSTQIQPGSIARKSVQARPRISQS